MKTKRLNVWTMTRQAAKAAGYRALTQVYCLPQEAAMMQAVRADLQRGKIAHVLVRENGGQSVWRRAGGGKG